jgi:hypothetical protein
MNLRHIWIVVLVVFSGKELRLKLKSHDDWTLVEPTPTPTPTSAPAPEPTPKKRGMIELNDEAMREAKKSLKEKGIKSEDVKNYVSQSLTHPLLRYTLSNALMIEIFLTLNLLINA